MKLTGCCRTEMRSLVRGSPSSNTLLCWQFLMRQILPQEIIWFVLRMNANQNNVPCSSHNMCLRIVIVLAYAFPPKLNRT